MFFLEVLIHLCFLKSFSIMFLCIVLVCTHFVFNDKKNMKEGKVKFTEEYLANPIDNDLAEYYIKFSE